MTIERVCVASLSHTNHSHGQQGRDTCSLPSSAGDRGDVDLTVVPAHELRPSLTGSDSILFPILVE